MLGPGLCCSIVDYVGEQGSLVGNIETHLGSKTYHNGNLTAGRSQKETYCCSLSVK